MDSDLWLVVGLGNPGKRYRGNRHNVGFMVVDALAASERDVEWRSSARFSAEVAKGLLAGQRVVLAKPQTFMNLSGRSVGPLAGFYGISVNHIVVVHDDVDLELGRLRVKAGGGDGGHKGVRSMTQDLGGPGFVRVRFGIGRPQVGEVTDFVLQNFDPDQRDALEEGIGRAAEAVCTVMTSGLKEAMNRYNGPPAGEAEAGEERGPEAQPHKRGERGGGVDEE
jgi:PTH1 family peptidyl-tRNA hydrolase